MSLLKAAPCCGRWSLVRADGLRQKALKELGLPEASGMQELVRCFDIPLHPEDGGHFGALCCGLPILQEAFFLSWNSPVAWRTCSPIAFSVPGSSMLPDEEGIGNTCAGFLAAVQAVLPHVPDSIARAC